MTPDRARDIIDAYGADSRRWPAAERDAARAMVAADAGLRADAEAAAGLDAMLGAWATAGVASHRFDLTTLPVRRPAPTRHWWRGTAAAAAAVAAGVALLTPMALRTPVPVASVEPRAVAATTDDGDGFSYVFTPTHDEESLI